MSFAPTSHRVRGLLTWLGLVVLLSPFSAVAAAAEEPVPTPPPGVSITVNALPMTGGEGGKISSCTFSLAVIGLEESADPPTAVDVTITAVAPAVPGGSPVDLVTDATTTSASTWSRDYPMDELVAPLTRHANGYHLRVQVAIDGTLAGSSVYWLGCGEPQAGNPTRLVFAVQWIGRDGTTYDEAPSALLPAGWEASFLVTGSSKIGDAACTYAPGSAELVCIYDNPGHGGPPGLVVPGNPKATYDVVLAGAPAEWTPDETTLGTFVGRDTCPRGGGGHDGGDEGGHEGGHDGGHETPPTVVPQAEEGGGGHDGGDGGGGGHGGEGTCVHTVVLVQAPEPPTSPPGEPPAPSASVSPTTAAEALGASAAKAPATGAEGVLPATGSAATGPLASMGVALAVSGALLVAASTRLQRRSMG